MNRFRDVSMVELMIFVGIVAIVGVIVANAVNTARHGGCAQFRSTGGMTCHTQGYTTTCVPTTVCVRYGDGTIP